jgi:hypothetical protein
MASTTTHAQSTRLLRTALLVEKSQNAGLTCYSMVHKD